MASIQGHGGACCGVRHMYGMDNTTVADVERLIAQVDSLVNVGAADSGRLIEVILSQRQVGAPNGGTGARWAACVQAEGGWPAVLERLGFRLVSRFNNANSGYDCFVFHRVPHFKSLRPTDLPFIWAHDGYVTHMAEAGGPGRLEAAAPVVELWPVGTRIRYAMNGAAESKRGCYGRVVGTSDIAGRYRIDWEDPRIQRQNGGPYTATYFERVAEAPVAVPVVVVATFYANVLQAGMGAFFPTVEAARAAAPRCRQQARIEISSDGTRRTVNL